MHQSWLLSSITPLRFFSLKTIYFGQKYPIRVQIFETFECLGQNLSISSCEFSNDKSIPLQTFHHYSISAHNSSVKFKLMHFWLWTKVSHESPNFDSFKCSGENLQNSLCHFPNNTSVFVQILHVSPASSKITPLYLVWPNVIYFAQNGPIKVQMFETFECFDQNAWISSKFWNNKLVFL